MEAWTDVLATLPVRSLLRCRCVSRSWKAVIDSPEFCREHLVRFKNNCDETHLLTVHGKDQCFVRYSDTMKISRRRLGTMSSLEFKSTAMPGVYGKCRILFSVDGLVLLKCDAYSKLVLWNPSIRKCRLVRSSQYTNFFALGLGFDPLIGDYKIVRVSYKTPSSVEIYTVGTSSWKAVAAQGALLSTWLQTFSERRSIYFKGCLYMLSSGKLISFDLSKAVFKSVDLPGDKKCAPGYIGDSLALVDSWSSLAVLQFSSHHGSVWVLDDNAAAAASSWSIRCTFHLRVPFFQHLKKNGDLLFTTYCFQMVSYNIHTKEEKLDIGTDFPRRTTRILGYKESLVLLK